MFYLSEAKNLTYALTVSWGEEPSIPIIGGRDLVKAKDLPEDIQKLKDNGYFIAGTPIDINNDGQEAIFVGGRRGQNDALYIYDKENKKMIDIIKKTNLSDLAATHSAISIDLDKDGYQDMIIARQSGVFLYKNKKDGTFSKQLILKKRGNSSPLALAITDYDKDGNPDLYVSQFIDKVDNKLFRFHDKDHSKKNTLLTYDSVTNKFREIPEQDHNIRNMNNTFTSIWTDINNDSYPDLININDTGQVGIYENKKDKTFKRHISYPYYGSWMGIAVGDIDHDGDQDYYISNIGNTIKVSDYTRGNLKPDEKLTHDHILLRNDGKFKFIDIGKEKNINDAGFSWGAVFADLNLDTHLDLLVSQNFDQIPTQVIAPLPSQRWLYDPKTKKYVKLNKYKNPAVGQTPLSVDIDGDGIQDVIWVNMIGSIKVYKVNNEDKNNFINIKLPDTIDFANAKVEVYANNKKFVKEYIIGGTGFASDMSQTLQFGLGKIEKVEKILVKTIYGKEYKFDNPKINSTVLVIKDK